jgi:NAD+ kinase
VLSPAVAANLVVPVAPHTLEARAIVTAPADVVEITLPNDARRDGCVTVDGDLMPCRRAIESVSIHTCESDVLLVKLDGRAFYEVARDEFLGG